jgi:hypothetical protein
MIPVFSLPYLPNIAWFQHVLQYKQIKIEMHEHFVKQTYRNRCIILSANGPLPLIIPVQHNTVKASIYNLKANSAVKWQQQHWNSIQSAYGKSAYFFHYKYYFEPLFNNNTGQIFNFNLELLKLVFKLLKIEPNWQFTNGYIKAYENLDFRDFFNAKKRNPKELIKQQTYPQVFAEKFGFEPNLSIVDLLFNMGPQSISVLLA